MSTTQEEKSVKPRSRSRKAGQKAAKIEAKAQVASDLGNVEAEPVSAMIAAAIEAAATEVAQAETTPAEMADADVAPGEAVTSETAPAVSAMEKTSDAALSGEVLPPEVRKPQAREAALSAMALAYGDYTRKSWAAGRFLLERLMTVRSFDEAVEVQGEFARQAYANFIAQSERMYVLYGEWARQYFKPYESLAAEWTRAGR